MRIGELAERSGVSRDAIRFYERQGLIAAQKSESQSNTYKNYPEEAVFTLEVIRDAQAAGVSIADLIVLLSQYHAADGADFDGEDFLIEKIQEVENRIEASQRFLETLRQTLRALKNAAH